MLIGQLRTLPVPPYYLQVLFINLLWTFAAIETAHLCRFVAQICTYEDA